MRYEFERAAGRSRTCCRAWTVTVDVDAADRPQFDRFFGEEVAYLDAGFDFGGGMDEAGVTTRRRRLDPLGVRTGDPEPGAPAGLHGPPRADGAGRGTGRASGGGRGPMKVTGAQALFRSLEGEGVDLAFGIPGGRSCPRTTR